MRTTSRDYSWLLVLGIIALCAAGIQWLGRYGATRESDDGLPVVEVWGWDIAAESLQALADGPTDEMRERRPDAKWRIFEEQYDPADVYVNMTGQQVSTRFLMSIAGNAGAPDICQMQEREAPKFAGSGRLADLTDWAAQYEDDFAGAFWYSCLHEGRVYAIPWDIGPCAVIYKRWLFERYDLDPWTIETWDDYIAMGVELLERSEGKTRMLPMATATIRDIFGIMMQQNGGGVFDAEGRIILDSQQNREALEVIRKMLDAGICAPITAYSPAMTASYSEDGVASYVNAVWGIKPIKTAAESTVGRWGVFRLPAFREGGLRTSNLGGSVLVIPDQSPVIEHAGKFLEFANCTVESQVQQFREFGLFPALLTTFDHPIFDEPDPFFGGQKVNRLFATDIDRIPTMIRTRDYNEAERYLDRSMNRWANENQDNDAYLQSVTRALSRSLGREIVPYEELERERTYP